MNHAQIKFLAGLAKVGFELGQRMAGGGYPPCQVSGCGCEARYKTTCGHSLCPTHAALWQKTPKCQYCR